jgi:hypothetical protein
MFGWFSWASACAPALNIAITKKQFSMRNNFTSRWDELLTTVVDLNVQRLYVETFHASVVRQAGPVTVALWATRCLRVKRISATLPTGKRLQQNAAAFPVNFALFPIDK